MKSNLGSKAFLLKTIGASTASTHTRNINFAAAIIYIN